MRSFCMHLHNVCPGDADPSKKTKWTNELVLIIPNNYFKIVFKHLLAKSDFYTTKCV